MSENASSLHHYYFRVKKVCSQNGLGSSNKSEVVDQKNPQMKRIYNVEQVLAECGILASFSVIQKYKWNHRDHCPLWVVAQRVIKVAGLFFEITGKSKY